ncbi:MAG: ribonucleoside-diphosphate reductase subunit alpha [Pseudomonadota bacterium]|uniref:Ribonucleoside-diphosphate reductase n=3 Tax=Qipengyuania pacifica TaxID=2860199 RepID=A0ABS7JAL0_9SPHN|nr:MULTISPECIES: ribonucleoside-diphosphate reductase subunit alpha [Erythrobacteraceae]MBL4895637.1 ribonucleoside-diphosphate reductase subunit alpha [Erythrobacter sp.]MEC7888598.1 ribonucleoside-diphosphate reductase subunit alpha [Pseudomonadota bacterium]QPL41218.1 ribonucleoside-diphosphate reductase subunit alpha [Erythrobacter sp. A30-3]MBX7487063.1 ribonucleoside-diphosphate reductase subunit alpha [Qipengyuania aerophila]MBY8332654.1 ribonucleoside-diphosphate reductase subunit alph
MDFKSGNDTAMALDLDTHDTVDEPTTKKKAVAMDKSDNGSEQLVQEAAGEALAGAVAAVAAQATKEDSKKVLDRRFDVQIDESRDALLTEFGKETLTDRYLLPGEKYQDLFARVADYFADDGDHAQRLYNYISNLWFMPATPVLSNGGTTRGLPISCYLNSVSDSLDGIVNTWNENVWLASKGGGIGTYWGNVRGIGEPVGLNGKTSGIIPFVRVMDSLTLAISQGSLRRGSAACYIDVTHPEIEEFLEIRKPSGDFNRKALNLHHGVLVTDAFMEAVRNGEEFDLVSPRDGSVRKTVDARSLFQKLVETRLATGEPYIVFSDTVNRMMPKHHRELGLKVSTSNLCAEITLPTGIDHLGNDRTAVCCLSSLNLEKWDEWNGDKQFIEDVMRFLDNVLQDYIDRAPDEMARAKYSAMRERSVGMGVMGFHSFLQSKGIGFESPMAKVWNLKMFKHISAKAEEASLVLAQERGPCPDAAETGAMERFSCKMAIAPTASISIICGGTSACIEPIPANIYTHKTLSGSFIVKNPYLEKILDKKSKNSTNIWNSILERGGSVQHLDFLTAEEKAAFKTSFEIDQRWLLEFAADRAPYIDQAQSLNLFIPADVDKWDLMMLHFQAWEKGIKSLYYLRSKSVQRAGFAGGVEADNTADAAKYELAAGGEQTDYEECLACQ